MNIQYRNGAATRRQKVPSRSGEKAGAPRNSRTARVRLIIPPMVRTLPTIMMGVPATTRRDIPTTDPMQMERRPSAKSRLPATGRLIFHASNVYRLTTSTVTSVTAFTVNKSSCGSGVAGINIFIGRNTALNTLLRRHCTKFKVARLALLPADRPRGGELHLRDANGRISKLNRIVRTRKHGLHQLRG